MDREVNTEEMMDELLGEVIGNIPEQKADQSTTSNTGDNDQTKLIDLSSPKRAYTKKVSFCAAENAKPNSKPKSLPCTKTSVICNSEAQPCTEHDLIDFSNPDPACTKTDVHHNYDYPDLTQNSAPMSFRLIPQKLENLVEGGD